MTETIMSQLKAVAAARPHLLVAYKNDLEIHDRDALREWATPNSLWLWVLRECGTFLTEIHTDWSKWGRPAANYWLGQQSVCQPAVIWVGAADHGHVWGRVQLVTKDVALVLVRQDLTVDDVLTRARAEFKTVQQAA